MAWIANLTKVTKDPTNGNIVATVVYTNGVETYTTTDIQGADLTIDGISSIVKTKLAVYETRDKSFTALQVSLGQILPK